MRRSDPGEKFKGLSSSVCSLLVIVLFICAFLCCFSLAFASVNIPLGSSFYDDLYVLTAHGLIRSDLSSTRPITREEAGRLLAEALYFSEPEDIPYSSAALLDRMAEEYEDELSGAEYRGRAPKIYVKPVDEFSITYSKLNGPFSIFNNEGIEYFEGYNATVRFQSRARLWNVFSFYIEPLGIYSENLGGVDLEGVEGDDETEARIHKGYLKCTIGNFEIEWGRDSLWWGPGYHGALLISNNARPFEMYKISNPRAILFPSIFRLLGPFRYTLFLSELDRKAASEHPPDSKLIGLRFDVKPHPLLELGTSYLVHCGGERPGIEHLDFSDYLYIFFSHECRGFDKRDSNKQFAVDAAFTIPGLFPVADSIKLYGEWGGEDQGYPPDRRAYLLGMALNDVFGAYGLVLRAEYTNLSPKSSPVAWYSHSLWSMTHYGRVFGHHAGTDSDDLFIEISHAVNDTFRYRVGFDRERGGISQEYPEEKYQFFIETGFDPRKWCNLTIRYGYEEITNVGNVEDAKEKNHCIGTELKFRF